MAEANKVPVEEQYYIVATADALAEPTLVLKHDDLFGVFDRFGDVDIAKRHDTGVYYRGTRFLSRLRLRFASSPPVLLSSTVRSDNALLAADLTNPDLHRDCRLWLPRGSLHIYRSQFLWDSSLYQRIRIRNLSGATVDVRLAIEYAADFVDIFEVRGTAREQRGELLEPVYSSDGVLIEYRGLDHISRRTLIRYPEEPASLTTDGLYYADHFAPGADCTFDVQFTFELGESRTRLFDYDSRLALATVAQSHQEPECAITTSNERFNDWLDRSYHDLRMLTTRNEDGVYPYAGVPWFATPFGRDGIITALECLWVQPQLARGVLAFLTRTQAREYSPERDAEPGKILHEARDGEMAALGEIPFGLYYGSVDSTPLYLFLASAYFRRTGDIEFLQSIWEGITLALEWVSTYGDIDRDGFVEYYRKSPNGLVQQGWKDSYDSVFHADGVLAEGPIALCEVQAYVFAAKMGLSEVAAKLGLEAEARRLLDEAERLQQRFEEAFWAPSLGGYAIALDGQKRQCLVRASNAGHALYCGIGSRKRVRELAEGLIGHDFYSGWGIRTIAKGEARYNPMSYHNGSIWPHDNAMISAGLSRYGFTDLSAQILEDLFQAAAGFDLCRLPELFCGFERRAGKRPTAYPVACSPQAWASAATFLLLKSSLGLSIDALSRRVLISRPALPESLEKVIIHNLSVGDATVDLRLFRSDGSVAVTVERRTGDVDILVLK